jgi:tripartite ATP-independent transporter DctP family solute receptor
MKTLFNINGVKRICSALAITSVAMLLATPAQSQDLKLRMSVESTPGASTQQILGVFRDSLKEQMGDSVAIEYFDSGTLGDEIVHMQQVRTGQLDVVPIGSDAVQLDSKFAVFDIPFLFHSREQVAAVLDGPIGEELDKSFQENAGLKILGFGEIGFRNISNNVRPIKVPADLKGIKLRTPGSKTRILSFEMLGATPIKMNIGEVYLALEQGVIDGQENPLGNIAKWSWDEVQKYISLSRHVYTPVTLVMNLKRYIALTDEQREQVNAAAHKAVIASREYGAANDAQLEEVIKTRSPTLQFNEIDSPAFAEIAKNISVEIGKIAGEDFTARFVAAANQ